MVICFHKFVQVIRDCAKILWALVMKDIGKTSQVPLIDFSEPIPKEQDVIRENPEGGGHICGVDYYLHVFHVKNLFSQSASYCE